MSAIRWRCLDAGAGEPAGSAGPADGETLIGGDTGVCWAGDICNAGELIQALDLHRDTPTDEVLRAAWARWSATMFTRVEGIFSLAVWDPTQLLLYRDPSGLVGLFHGTTANGEVTFATAPEALLRTRGTGSRLARGALHEYLGHLDVSAPSTIYRDVLSVRPGWTMRFARGTPPVASNPGARTAISVPERFDDAVEAVEAVLARAIAMRLQGSDRPAAFLSGGIDSSLICALAHRQQPDLVALTVGFEGGRFDESPLAARVAAHLGMKHEVLRFGQRDLVAAFGRLVDCLEQPMADPTTPATVLAFDHCRQAFDLVLDGTGADEAVGALPPRHLRVAVQYGSLVPRAMRAAIVQLMRVVPRVAGYAPILDFEHPAETLIRWHGFTRREIEALCGESVSFEGTTFYRTFAGFPRHAHFERYTALLSTMSSDRLSQAALASGMRVRYPFLDRQVDEFIRQLPVPYRCQPGQAKRILRAILARHVPRAIWDVPKHGFDFPLVDFLVADDHALVRRHLVDGRWLDRGVLDADAARQYARRFMAGDRRLVFRVWALVVLGAWLDKHPDVGTA